MQIFFSHSSFIALVLIQLALVLFREERCAHRVWQGTSQDGGQMQKVSFTVVCASKPDDYFFDVR